ncbi:amidase [Chenggangzhangella methanolivorans]|uniref:Amidase n=1 Tax=Chenggangzhangella methanolivorans TaxID=1437009 RepID=A0A9E6UM20_9HYPH|nr:amidase [Chenggangzhangella methanolivorans]QZN98728.1 amidase [Chenggangzhangella methanolivorans]
MLAKLGLREAVSGLNEGRFALSDYVGALYDRARRLDGEVKAFGWLPEAGGAGEASPAAGPFAGVPVGIKDLIDVGGVPTTYGSAGFADHRPERDAWAVARLKSLGASVFGKTVTTEFAWRDPGATRNPWSLGHTPGGSSSGSAAAVAAGFVPLALGTQTFGSVVRPAAYCGVVGFKPSFGAIPRTGAHPLSPSLDHIGVFARNVGDAAFAIGRLAAVSDEDEDGRDIPGLPQALAERDGPPSIGLLRTADWDLADREQRDLLEKVAADLAAAGARVDELTPPDAFAEIPAGARVLLAAEAADVFSRLIAERPGRSAPPSGSWSPTGRGSRRSVMSRRSGGAAGCGARPPRGSAIGTRFSPSPRPASRRRGWPSPAIRGSACRGPISACRRSRFRRATVRAACRSPSSSSAATSTTPICCARPPGANGWSAGHAARRTGLRRLRRDRDLSLSERCTKLA